MDKVGADPLQAFHQAVDSLKWLAGSSQADVEALRERQRGRLEFGPLRLEDSCGRSKLRLSVAQHEIVNALSPSPDPFFRTVLYLEKQVLCHQQRFLPLPSESCGSHFRPLPRPGCVDFFLS